MRQLPVLKHMLIFFCILGIFTSCVNTKPHTYFNDLKNNVFADTLIEPAIQKNDLLSISVTSLNPEATEVFNRPNESVIAHSSGNGVSAITTGYLVDQSGHINFPILGAFKAEGL